MTDPVSPKQTALLDVFASTYDTIMRKDEAPVLSEKDPYFNAVVRRIGPIFALELEENVRALALLEQGMVVPFAKVNGKGYVETVGNTSETLMAALVQRGVLAPKAASQKEEPMMHYGSKNEKTGVPVFPKLA